MSFTDRLVLWLHIAFAIFTIGPVTLAISSTPRYIRKHDVAILRYLARTTAIFTFGSLLVLVFGIVAGDEEHDFSHPWLTAAMTLFVVALVLLVLVIRDQRRAIKALAAVLASGRSGDSGDDGGDDPEAAGQAGDAAAGGVQLETGTLAGTTVAQHVASVERGRITAMGGVVNLLWLVILVLMVWQP